MTWDPSKVIFTDCETTGLDVFRHDAWEIAWIEWDKDIRNWKETVYYIWPPALQDAEPMALAVNDFYGRVAQIQANDGFSGQHEVAEQIAYRFAGKHVIGACPWFDDRFYQKLLLNMGFQVSWHYHLLDVEAAALGFLSGRKSLSLKDQTIELPLPWKSDWLAEQLGMTRPEKKERHTALGDAREVKATFELIFGHFDGYILEPL